MVQLFWRVFGDSIGFCGSYRLPEASLPWPWSFGDDGQSHLVLEVDERVLRPTDLDGTSGPVRLLQWLTPEGRWSCCSELRCSRLGT
jgi:hypothetical protein